MGLSRHMNWSCNACANTKKIFTWPVTRQARATTRRTCAIWSAIGRIGSLKLKFGDRNGALEAYAALFREADNASPMPSWLEKSNARIK
jgi:hypothetical protein